MDSLQAIPNKSKEELQQETLNRDLLEVSQYSVNRHQRGSMLLEGTAAQHVTRLPPIAQIGNM